MTTGMKLAIVTNLQHLPLLTTLHTQSSPQPLTQTTLSLFQNSVPKEEANQNTVTEL